MASDHVDLVEVGLLDLVFSKLDKDLLERRTRNSKLRNLLSLELLLAQGVKDDTQIRGLLDFEEGLDKVQSGCGVYLRSCGGAFKLKVGHLLEEKLVIVEHVLHGDRVALAILFLEMAGASIAHESAVDHDDYVVA